MTPHRKLLALALFAFVVVGGGGVRGPAARAQDAPEPATPTALPGVSVDRERVTLNLRNAPLGDVLRQLAELYELNLNIPADVAGKPVTIRFKSVPIDEALDSIVRQAGYALVRRGSILEVVPPDRVPVPASRLAQAQLGGVSETAIAGGIAAAEIRIFDVKYARGEDLAKLVDGLLTPKIGYVAYESQRAKLLVRDFPENLVKIADLVAKIDAPPAEGAAVGTAQQPAQIKVVKLRYIETASIRKVLEKVSKAEQVDIEEEPTTKSIVIRGFPERIAAVERMIQTLDQKTSQVRIRCRIVETGLGNNEKLGLNWTVRLRANGAARPWTFPFFAHNVDTWAFYPTPNPTATVGGGFGGGGVGGNQLAGFAPGDSMPQTLSDDFTFGILDATQFSVLIEAIAQDSTSELIASPQLTTLDNHPARIVLGTIQPVPIFTNILNAETNTVFPTVTGFEDIEVGTILQVTPRVGADEFVTLDVKPEISEIIGFVGQNQERPIRSQRRMETSVVLRSGSTLALGGLNQTKKNEVVSKVPFLGDIPLLGYLFRHKSLELQKTDLLIFITPEIVKDDESAAERTPAEKEAREKGLVRIGERWVSASQLDATNRVGKQLSSPSPALRRAAVSEVVLLGDAERAEMIKRANILSNVLKADLDVDVKRAAADALGALDPARLASELATLPGRTPVQAVGQVLVPRALRSPSRSVRQLILANAIKVDRASTVTALMAAVAFGKPFERLAGADGLALAGDPASVSVLEEALAERKAPLSLVAADAIGACGGPQAVKALLGTLGQRPVEPRLELHAAAALAEAIGDDAKMAKELAARGITLSPRVKELLLFERRERRARFDRVLKAYAAVEPADGPEVTGPAEAAGKMREALRLLTEHAPGHRHLVAVTLRGIDIVVPGAGGKAGAAKEPSAATVERIEGGRLKIGAGVVATTPAVHLAHALVYHAAVVDLTALPAAGGGPGAGAGAAPAAAPGAISHRIEEAALREQFFALQALAGRAEFRDMDGGALAIDESLMARDLWPTQRPQAR